MNTQKIRKSELSPAVSLDSNVAYLLFFQKCLLKKNLAWIEFSNHFIHVLFILKTKT